jgi:pyridoxal phosphate enzyme (YggS family)
LDRLTETESHDRLVAAFVAARARAISTIAEACARADRDLAAVTLLPVSKTVPAERLRAAVEAGLTLLGENRVQEAEAKAPQLPGVRWHLIGPLQSNKARKAVELFEVVQTVDSLDLARRLDRLAGELGRAPLSVYLQANVDRDTAKSGFEVEDIARDLPEMADLPNLRLEGLMTVGRLVAAAEEARPTFRRLRALSERLRATPAGRSLGSGLSMGMTSDFAVAVEEGATLVRVGRDIFGERAAARAERG